MHIQLEHTLPLLLSSSAFSQDGLIPVAYTCDGSNVSPPLAWSNVPAGTRRLALFCYDPDAPGGTFHHWAAFNIAPGSGGLPEGAARSDKAAFPQAVNDFGRAGYDGPCPPHGHGSHHYHFRLSALKDEIDPAFAKARCRDVLRIAKELEIAAVELIGRFER